MAKDASKKWDGKNWNDERNPNRDVPQTTVRNVVLIALVVAALGVISQIPSPTLGNGAAFGYWIAGILPTVLGVGSVLFVLVFASGMFIAKRWYKGQHPTEPTAKL